MKKVINSKNLNKNLEYIQYLLNNNFKYKYCDAINTYISVFNRYSKNNLNIIIYPDNSFQYDAFGVHSHVDYYLNVDDFINNLRRKNKIKKLL